MHGPTRGPSQDSARVLFTKVYSELSSRIHQSLRSGNNRAAFQAQAGAPDVKKRLAHEKEGDEGLPRQLRVKQRSLTKVWNRALSKNCRDIKV
jgi:hypothetical protein